MGENDVILSLPLQEAQSLYVHLHQLPGGEERFQEAYLQLQRFFFGRLTVDELTQLLEAQQ